MNPLKYPLILFFLVLINLTPLGRTQSLFAQINIDSVDASYTTTKKNVATSKSLIRSDRVSDDSLSRLFTSLLTEKIIPHWLSTPWSFEGHTSVPRQGEIRSE